MIPKVMNKDMVVEEIAVRTGFYRSSIREIINTLGEVLVENFHTADETSPSEVHFMSGITLGAKWKPNGKAVDPRNGDDVVTPERRIPYLKYTRNLRDEISLP